MSDKIGINVLSLCDGMSCGRIALKELDIKINNYYASEIDKFAIQNTKHNFPDTIHLGDITLWRTWDIDWTSIDLILAGTPCQGFSFAGQQLAFNDPRSRLFFVFIDILNHIINLNPNVKFLLENVNMKKTHLEVITRYCGVFPVRINSNLVSAQNRDRWYWTNIKTKSNGLFGELYVDIPQPKDEGIFLKDILESDVDEKYYIKNPKLDFNGMDINEKARTLRTGGSNSQSDKHNCDLISIPFNCNGKTHLSKSGALLSCYHRGMPNFGSDTFVCVAMRGRGDDNQQRLGENKPGKINSITTVQKDNLILQTKKRIRRLTPTECARLQTVPDWYEWVVSDTQQYKMLGNGWTIKVIKHILSYYK